MSINFEYCLDKWNEHMIATPDNIVLSDSLGHSLTRSECDNISSSIYAWLKGHNIGKEQFVLINLDRGVKPVLAILGVLKSGAAFSLVESTYARERIAFIKEDCGAVIEINEGNWKEILATPPLSGFEKTEDTDACLAVYTSGTTGTPKGIVHEYGQLKMEMISEQRPDGTWRENVDTKWGLVAPLNFVASLKIVVHFIYCGGHLHVLDYNTVKNSKKLNSYFLTHKINETFLSPSLLRIKGDNYGPFMKYIYTGAEPANDVFVKHAELNNTYTMSESFFTVCEYIIDRPYSVVPIGNPMFDLDIKLIDEQGNNVPDGENGELCYRNPYCRGYLHNETENKKHFINGWYHTGDIAVYSDGLYILKGRTDDMIKINGNRIEPSEIEAVCRDVLGLSVCVAKGYEEGFVALYYTDDVIINEEDARNRLNNLLPYYMIPSYYVKIDKFPLTQSGKLDHKALKIPKETYKAEYVAPRNSFEQDLCNSFSIVLEIENIGIKDDFFNLGGSSIKVIQSLEYMEHYEDLTPSMIYEGRTVEKISELYKTAVAEHLSPEEMEKLAIENPCPISEVQSLFWNDFYDCSLDFYFGVKIIPFVPAELIAQRLNRYIDSNSTFNMVIQNDQDGKPVQTYVPDKPYVRVENMSFKEANSVADSFIQRFSCGEPLIRIRLLKTPVCTFFLYHGSHVVMDGAACHHAIEDMTAAVFDKEFPKTDYFAFVYKETMRNNHNNFESNLEFFKEKYFTKPCLANLRADEGSKDSVRHHAKPFSIPLKSLRKFCDERGISINVFINTAVLLAICQYNQSENALVFWNYHNRGANSPRGGIMYRSAINSINTADLKSLNDAFDFINKQNEECLWRYSDHDYYRAFSHLIRGPKMTISYMEGWFTDDLPKKLGLFCRKIKLKNNLKSTSKTSTNTLLTFSHYHNNLFCSFQYCTSLVCTENADRFMEMLKNSMEDMMTDKLPVIGKSSK